MLKNIFETIVGGVVLIVAFAFVMTAYKSGSIDTSPDGYTLIAKFDKVDGLSVGSDVRMSGIKIGKVVEQTFDPETYRAVVKFTVKEDIKIPSDSSADIIGDGLLGSKYLSISAGGDDTPLDKNQEILITQSAVSFEQLIGKFIHGGSDDKSSPSSSDDKKPESSSPSSSLFTEPLSTSTPAVTEPAPVNYQDEAEEKKPEVKKPEVKKAENGKKDAKKEDKKKN